MSPDRRLSERPYFVRSRLRDRPFPNRRNAPVLHWDRPFRQRDFVQALVLAFLVELAVK